MGINIGYPDLDMFTHVCKLILNQKSMLNLQHMELIFNGT
jgi:hypothetical protein